MRKKIGIVSLGCAKNRVDSESILAMFPDARYEITPDPAAADLIIVNTCGFIDAAKRESIETLLEMKEYRKAKLVATGCFVTRNLEELSKSLPEVDLWVPLEDYPNMGREIAALLGDETPLSPFDLSSRVLSTDPWMAYLKIAEGCDNRCSFCAIPLIRGRLSSRPLETLVSEAKSLREKGVTELCLISQDPLHYGYDFPTRSPGPLALLKALDALGFRSIRLLYLYPEEITPDLLSFIKDSHSIEPYFDIPLQSAAPSVLKRMNRHGTIEEAERLFDALDALFPRKALRTTLIAGFPGETEEDHRLTLEFLKRHPFDHLGVFPYSREEGTPAYHMKGQVPRAVKERRAQEIRDLAKKESYARNKGRIGEIMEGYVLGPISSSLEYGLRVYWNAPDDIDGKIVFQAKSPHKAGEIVRVRIDSAFVHDLHAVEVD